MRYLVYPLAVFKNQFWSVLEASQKDVYPDEPEVKKENLIPYEENSLVLCALKENRVVGYCITIFCKEPRTNEMYASSLWFYVDSEYRSGLVPGKLIKGSEEIACVNGCNYYKWDINTDSPLISAFDKREDYKKESIIYTKELIRN